MYFSLSNIRVRSPASTMNGTKMDVKKRLDSKFDRITDYVLKFCHSRHVWFLRQVFGNGHWAEV